MDLDLRDLRRFVEANKRKPGARFRFDQGPISVWLRVAVRHVGFGGKAVIDLADVTVDPDHRRKGVFKEFLTGLEAIARDEQVPVYVQSIVSEYVVVELKRRGYTFRQDGAGVDAWLDYSAKPVSEISSPVLSLG